MERNLHGEDQFEGFNEMSSDNIAPLGVMSYSDGAQANPDGVMPSLLQTSSQSSDTRFPTVLSNDWSLASESSVCLSVDFRPPS